MRNRFALRQPLTHARCLPYPTLATAIGTLSRAYNASPNAGMKLPLPCCYPARQAADRTPAATPCRRTCSPFPLRVRCNSSPQVRRVRLARDHEYLAHSDVRHHRRSSRPTGAPAPRTIHPPRLASLSVKLALPRSVTRLLPLLSDSDLLPSPQALRSRGPRIAIFPLSSPRAGTPGSHAETRA